MSDTRTRLVLYISIVPNKLLPRTVPHDSRWVADAWVGYLALYSSLHGSTYDRDYTTNKTNLYFTTVNTIQQSYSEDICKVAGLIRVLGWNTPLSNDRKVKGYLQVHTDQLDLCNMLRGFKTNNTAEKIVPELVERAKSYVNRYQDNMILHTTPKQSEIMRAVRSMVHEEMGIWNPKKDMVNSRSFLSRVS